MSIPVGPEQVPAAKQYSYHVVIFASAAPGGGDVRLDLSEETLRARVIEPYVNAKPVTIGGTCYAPGEIRRVKIYRTTRCAEDVKSSMWEQRILWAAKRVN
jgi:hypothetical protein